MSIRVTTENGSVYNVDQVEKTWSRVDSTEKSGTLQKDSENPFFLMSKPCVGRSLTLVGPAIDAKKDFRLLQTSRVTKIEEIV